MQVYRTRSIRLWVSVTMTSVCQWHNGKCVYVSVWCVCVSFQLFSFKLSSWYLFSPHHVNQGAVQKPTPEVTLYEPHTVEESLRRLRSGRNSQMLPGHPVQARELLHVLFPPLLDHDFHPESGLHYALCQPWWSVVNFLCCCCALASSWFVSCGSLPSTVSYGALSGTMYDPVCVLWRSLRYYVCVLWIYGSLSDTISDRGVFVSYVSQALCLCPMKLS